MALKLAAIIPHTPLLINKGEDEVSEKLHTAVDQITELIHHAKIDNVITVSYQPKAKHYSTIQINQAAELQLNLKQFGNLEDDLLLKNNIGLGYQIKEKLETSLPIQLIANHELDSSLSTALYRPLKDKVINKIIPIHTALLNSDKHKILGTSIRKIIDNKSTKTAILIVANLSYTLSENSPAGFDKTSQEYDKQIIEFIKNKELNRISMINDDIIRSAKTDSYQSLQVLNGVLSETQYQTQILSYINNFGIGYLTAVINL